MNECVKILTSSPIPSRLGGLHVLATLKNAAIIIYMPPSAPTKPYLHRIYLNG